MAYSLLSCFLLYININLINAQTFCGQFDTTEANGANGYIELLYSGGDAKYSFNVDLSNFDFSADGLTGIDNCDISNGLSWHIHTYWTSTTTTSAAGPDGCTSTSGHYDPSLACGPKSQSASTLCPGINRTSSQGYTYSCSSSNYALGYYDSCEQGDLSGKFGKAYESTSGNLQFNSNGVYTDNNPPYMSNLNNPDELTNQWASVVFHCGNGDRLICTKMNQIPSGSSCDGTAIEDDDMDMDDDSCDAGSNKSLLVAILIFVILIFICILMLLIKVYTSNTSNTSGSNTNTNTNSDVELYTATAPMSSNMHTNTNANTNANNNASTNVELSHAVVIMDKSDL